MGESPQEQPQETSGPKTLWSNGYVKFGLAALIYLLWVVWVGNYWLLLGLGVLFDIYVTQKVRWAFWKSKKEKPSAANEWIDAGIFAVVAAMLIRTFFIEAFTIPTSSMEKTLLVGDYLFVSKVSYGPRMPNTPLAIPFTHHTMPFTQYGRPYVEWARWPYRRLAGLGEVQRNDVMVFNYPEGDTVAGDIQAKSYYQLCREYGQAAILENQLLRNYGQRPGPILVRPVDKRENYIKRCVGLPGDIIEVRGTQLYVNGQPQEKVGDTQFKYALASTLVFRRDSLLDMGISYEDQDLSAPLTRYYSDLLTANPRLKDFISLRNDSIILNTNILVYPLTESMVRRFSGYGFVKAIEPIIQPDSLRSRSISRNTRASPGTRTSSARSRFRPKERPCP